MCIRTYIQSSVVKAVRMSSLQNLKISGKYVWEMSFPLHWRGYYCTYDVICLHYIYIAVYIRTVLHCWSPSCTVSPCGMYMTHLSTMRAQASIQSYPPVAVARLACCSSGPVSIVFIPAAEVVRWDEGGRSSESALGMSKAANSTVRSLESLKSWGTLGTTSTHEGGNYLWRGRGYSWVFWCTHNTSILCTVHQFKW